MRYLYKPLRRQQRANFTEVCRLNGICNVNVNCQSYSGPDGSTEVRGENVKVGMLYELKVEKIIIHSETDEILLCENATPV